MNPIAWLIAIAAGAVLGLLAALVRRPHGFAASVLLGALGGGIGAWLAVIFGLPVENRVGLAVAAAAGAAVLVVLSFAMRRV